MAGRSVLTRIPALFVLLLLLFAAGESRRAFAAEFTITPGAADAVDASPGDGVCDDGAGNCTLRAAIMETNALPGHDIINMFSQTALTIAGAGEDAAATGDLDVTDDLTLWGGAAGHGIDANGLDRALHVIGSDTELTIRDSTISNGDAGGGDGGGILAEGPLTLIMFLAEGNSARRGGGVAALSDLTTITAAIFDGNTASEDGGGIYSTGTGYLPGVRVQNNDALGAGGGIANFGTLELPEVSGAWAKVLEDNTAGGNGGGIYSAGAVTIDGASVTGNTAGHAGGGISNDGTLALTEANVVGNSTAANEPGDDGGGVHNDGIASIDHSTIAENSGRVGGGLFNEVGKSLVITDSVVRDNEAGFGGGVGNSPAPDCPTPTGEVTIIRSTLSGNSAFDGGAIWGGGGTATISESTISGNTAHTGGAVMHGCTLNLTNSTIAGTIWSSAAIVATNATLVGAVGSKEGRGTLTLANTIIDTCDLSGHPAVNSMGHNLNSNGTCGLTGEGDLSGVDPLLGPLADNEWVTQTHALLAGSPAIDAGDNAACPPIDQRLVLRPQDGDGDGVAVCDIGAYEVREVAVGPTATPTVLPPGGGPPAPAGESAGWPLAALAAVGAALAGGGGLTLVALRRRR
jgi:predicted outer membrane repeat protein